MDGEDQLRYGSQVDSKAGTAIVEFQGRPYLVGLRHLRPLRESYMQFTSATSSSTSAAAEAALHRMKMLVEKATPYRPFTMGEILKQDKDEMKMIQFPKEPGDTVKQMLQDAQTFLKYHHDKVIFHGIRYGRGLKTILVPRYSKGTLITWSDRVFLESPSPSTTLTR